MCIRDRPSLSILSLFDPDLIRRLTTIPESKFVGTIRIFSPFSNLNSWMIKDSVLWECTASCDLVFNWQKRVKGSCRHKITRVNSSTRLITGQR